MTLELKTDWYDALIIGEYHRTNKSGPRCVSISTVNLRFFHDTGADLIAMVPVHDYLFRNGIINWSV